MMTTSGELGTHLANVEAGECHRYIFPLIDGHTGDLDICRILKGLLVRGGKSVVVDLSVGCDFMMGVRETERRFIWHLLKEVSKTKDRRLILIVPQFITPVIKNVVYDTSALDGGFPLVKATYKNETGEVWSPVHAC